jgi:hypothetical protein
LKGDEATTATDFEAANPDDRIIFLANLWLDQPETVTRLRTVLSGAQRCPSLA